MNFNELSLPWKRIFELDWISICAGSKELLWRSNKYDKYKRFYKKQKY